MPLPRRRRESALSELSKEKPAVIIRCGRGIAQETGAPFGSRACPGATNRHTQGMAQSRVITVIPVYNGERFIRQTLESLARQTVRPDRVVVLDNCSTDRTEEIVRGFELLRCEWVRNERNLGLFGNMNRALDFAAQTRFLHILPADDLVAPRFFEVMLPALEPGEGLGVAWCLDERIDEEGRRLSLSGRVTGRVRELTDEQYLKEKAEIGNQALGGTLFRTAGRESPCRFRMDMPILADVVFYGEWGQHCERIVRVEEALVQFRWHGGNMSCEMMPALQPLVLDEWKTMQHLEALRGGSGWVRACKLRGLFGVRAGIKARRIRQLGNRLYSRQIVQAGRQISGWPLWLVAQCVVHARELLVYGIMRRRRHPQNVFG